METLLGPLFESIEDPQQWQEFLVHFARAMNAPTAVSFINFRHPVAGNVAKTTGGAGIDQAFVAPFERTTAN